ncbi:MAG TPA: DUF3606 domain-containing protein [Xanthomonadaceae bacterium]|nr:DUF3606 domain-containing protein [Xanthomonadaceae bacterium]
MPSGNARDTQPDGFPREPVDRQRVALTGEWELLWWCRSFGVDEHALRAAVDAAGNDVEAVRRHLQTDSKP